VNWKDLKKQGFDAVVLYKASDAAVLGVSWEAGSAGLEVYEIYLDGLLLKVSQLEIVRIKTKEAVLGLSPEQLKLKLS